MHDWYPFQHCTAQTQVFPQGWDKTYCLRYLEDFQEIHFFGDKTYQVIIVRIFVNQLVFTIEAFFLQLSFVWLFILPVLVTISC